MFDKKVIKKLGRIDTPYYYYDLELLRNTLAVVKEEADRYKYKVHYAFKANANDRILNVIRDYGFGADCVSGYEVRKALEKGFDNRKVVFAGVGKAAEVHAAGRPPVRRQRLGATPAACSPCWKKSEKAPRPAG